MRTQAGLSDSHRGGRSVIVLHFENGLRLVYKPRPMQIDAAFSDLLARLNEQFTPPLRPLEVLAREDYGWENFVEHSPCRDRHGAGQFFQRAGALLYLFHTLRGVDLHRENMIATADGPVLVDLEALCHPPFAEPIMLENGAGGHWSYDSSVFRTGMLPIPGRRPDGGRFRNLSALDGSILQHSPPTDIRWRNVNSDEMEAAPGSSRMVCGTHRARLHGRLLPLRRYGGELVDGFRRMARLFRSGENSASPWRALAASMHALETRLIKRPTFLYAMMIRQSLQPRFLVEGVDRIIELQALPFRPGDEDYRPAELSALEGLDVPTFFRKQEIDDAPIDGPTETDAELASQVAAIRASIARRRNAARQKSPPPS